MDIPELFDVEFVFWVCPNGCQGFVDWEPDKTDARCRECGLRRSEVTAETLSDGD